MTISIDGGKAFDKMWHLFVIKTFNIQKKKTLWKNLAKEVKILKLLLMKIIEEGKNKWKYILYSRDWKN